MRCSQFIVLFLVVGSIAAGADEASPVSKAVQLLGDLQTKMIKDGEAGTQNFEEYSRWCERTSMEKQHALKDMGEQIVMFQASIEDAGSSIAQLKAKVEVLSSDISTAEEQQKETKAVRAKEHADFLKHDADLSGTIGMLNQAHRVLKANVDKAGQPNSESLMQVTDTLKKMVDASFVGLEDKSVLTALLQQSSDETDGSEEVSDDLQPNEEADAYKEKSGGIIDTLQSMKEKAEVARNELQKQEMRAAGANDLFQQSVSQELASLKKQMDAAKKHMNKSAEQKATAEGGLELVQKDKASEEAFLADLQKDCMSKADEFQTEQKERAAEINVLKEARMILMKGAFVQTGSDSPSFLQTRSHSRMAVRGKSMMTVATESQMLRERQMQAANFLSGLGENSNNWVLAQIANHLQADPFGKVKDMITEMVEKLLQEQAEEAEHKAWCDAEMAKTSKQVKSNTARVQETNVRIDEASSASSKLNRQIKTLIKEMGQIDSAQAEATSMRNQENAEFKVQREDLQAGQKAVITAIQVLRNYYEGGSFVQRNTDASMESLMQVNNQDQATGSASNNILALLEVAESDFSKGIAEMNAGEDVAVEEYKKLSQDNRVARASKLADQKGKEQEEQHLNSLVSQTKLDLKDSQEELDAIMEYMDKLRGSCETKAPAFEERQARRKQELEGLQNALAILEGKAIALLQDESPASLLRR